jgi:hypothetical protein
MTDTLRKVSVILFYVLKIKHKDNTIYRKIKNDTSRLHYLCNAYTVLIDIGIV